MLSEIFNADETALLWQTLSNKTLNLKDSTVLLWRKNEQGMRLGFASCQMRVSFKLRLFLIAEGRFLLGITIAKGNLVQYAFYKKVRMAS